ncbi:MAG TPA: Gfo/Idh/MocA family oxidoreductase [Candidatus Binatia bacterium]|jgi:predicted dehydrogenase
MTADKKLRVGVIGGGYGRNHILAYQASGCEVAAFCQRSEAKAAKLAHEFAIPNIYADYRDLLALSGLDAVSIATPPNLHRPIAVEAVERGLHVLCEKPLALDVVEAETMLARAEAARRVHMTAFNFRGISAVRRMKELLEEGFVGRIFHVEATWLTEGRMAPDTPMGWRHRKATAGFGVLGDTGVHMIDLVRWLVGDFQKVTAQATTFHGQRKLPDGSGTGNVEVEDSCMFLAQLGDGIQASLHVSGVARGSLFQSIRIFGGEGALAVAVNRKGADWVVGRLSGVRGVNAEFQPLEIPERLTRGLNLADPSRVAGEFLFAQLTRRFSESIESGAPAVPSFREGLEAQKVVAAVLRSVDEQCWVEVG